MRSVHLYMLTALVLAGAFGCAGDEGERPKERAEVSPMAGSYLKGALRMAQQQQYEEALAAVERAKRLSPDAPAVYAVEGQVNLAAKKFEAARSALERAVELDPSEARNWELLGHTAFQSRQFRDALTYYQQAEEREPSLFVWQGIASAYRELYRPDSAAMAYRRVVSTDSSFAPAWAGLAEIREDEGAYEEALRFAEHASRSAPRAVPYQFLRARLMVRTGRAGEAIPLLEEIVHNNPTHYGALYNLGLAYQREGREDVASETLERAAQLRHRMRERKQL